MCAKPAAETARYWSISANLSMRWRAVTWVNKPPADITRAKATDPTGYPFGGNGRGFDFLRDLQVPHFRTKRKNLSASARTCYFPGDSWFICSAGLANILRELQPKGVETLDIDVELGDGTMLPTGAFVLFDITQIVDAYDAEAMGRRVYMESFGPAYDPPLYHGLVFRSDIGPDIHLFRDRILPNRMHASPKVRKTLRKAGMERALSWDDSEKRPVHRPPAKPLPHLGGPWG
jgi:hypothetical protein